MNWHMRKSIYRASPPETARRGQFSMIKNVLVPLFFLFWLAPFATASVIRLDTTVTATVTGTHLNLKISIFNKGDEPAYAVQAEIKSGQKAYFMDKHPRLGVAQAVDFDRILPAVVEKEGLYPLVIVLHYNDAKGYPFSALHCQTVASHSHVPVSKIDGRIHPVALSEKKTFRMTIENIGKSALETKITPIVPGEFKITPENRQIEIPPESSKTLQFTVENVSAVNGSQYQIYAILEYDKNNIHQTSIVPGKINVVSEKKIMGLAYRTFVLTLIALSAVFFAAQFKQREKA